MEAKKLHHLQGHRSAIYSICRFKNESTFLTAGGDGMAVVWDLNDPENGKVVSKVETQLFNIGYFHDHQILALGNMNGGIHFVDLSTGHNVQNLMAHEKGVFGFLELENHFISIGGKGALIKWDLKKLQATESIRLTNQSLRGIAYSRERHELAVGASDHHIYLLDAEHLTLKHRIENAHESSVFSLVYHPDGAHLITGGRDAHLRSFNLENYQQVEERPAHHFTINDLCLHPNGHLLATASRDKTIKIWDVHTFELKKVLDLVRYGAHANSVNALWWSSYRDTLVSVSDDRSIALWELT
ncbi:MAG: WD40 repeat domain-containing protein [Bacteroidota bacterium]